MRGALELGFHTVLVLTGNTGREDVARYPSRPSHVVESIADLDPVALAATLLAAGEAGITAPAGAR